MADQVAVTQKITFESNAQLLLQPNGGDLMDTAKPYDLEGNLCELDDFFGAIVAQEIEDRHTTLPPTDGTQDRLWLAKPRENYVRKLINRQDQIAATIDLKSGYMMQMQAAIRRYWTIQFLKGFFSGRLISAGPGGAQPGIGTQQVAFPTGQVVPANAGFSGSGSNHLNVKKMQLARQLLALGNVDFQSAKGHMAVTPIQVTDLFNEVQITSSEFTNMGGRLGADGKTVEQFMGFRLHEVNMADPTYSGSVSTTYTSPTTAQTVRKLPFWADGGVVSGWWGGRVWTNMSIRDDLNYETQIQANSCCAVTRTQDGMGGFIEAFEG